LEDKKKFAFGFVFRENLALIIYMAETNRVLVNELEVLFPKMRGVLGEKMNVGNELDRAIEIVATLCMNTKGLLENVEPSYREPVLDSLGIKGYVLPEGFTFLESNECDTVQAVLWATRKHFSGVSNHILYGHLSHVGKLAKLIGRELGMSEADLLSLYLAGAMHDTGKVDPIVDYIVSKPRKLSTEEKEPTQVHAMLSYLVATILNASDTTKRVALAHHEKLDGSGYPLGLMADKICAFTRIVTLVDIFDAMTDNRPGLIPKNLPEAMGEIRKWENRGALDKDVVKAFFDICKKIGLIEGEIESDLKVKSSHLVNSYDNISP